MYPKSIHGIWQSKGYGYVIHISRWLVTLYEVTEISCLRTTRLPASRWLLGMVGFKLQMGTTEDDLVILVDKTDRIELVRIHELPTRSDPKRYRDPNFNYEVFWHIFHEHYAFFDLYDVDWNQQMATYRPLISADTDDAELFQLMCQSAEGLNDGHVSLVRDEERFSPYVRVPWFQQIGTFRQSIFDHYVQGEIQHTRLTGISYGWLTDNIGYIHLHSMQTKPRLGQSEDQPAAQAMQQVDQSLSTATHIVIDVRFNPGGSDSVSLAIAAAFTSTKTLAFTKSTRIDSTYSTPHELYIEPQGEALFEQPVYLLTSRRTASAAEIFTLAMRELPQVTVVGERTGGGLSDVLSRELPNGWEIGLSNQRYLSVDGALYEGVGVPVDVDVPLDAEAFVDGQDVILETAIQLANA
ncbi:MAG: S41 family peptidase [Chloroflexota bacterium]